MQVYPASAIYPGFDHQESVGLIHKGVAEKHWGHLDMAHMQLCPQHTGTLSLQGANDLRYQFSGTQFRLHANVSLGGIFGLFDASTEYENPKFMAWRRLLKEISLELKAPAYTWHAGRRRTDKAMQTVSTNTLKLQEELGIPVGVEGLYPSGGENWAMNSSDEYRWVLEKTDINFAIDLSHWKIIAHKEKTWNWDLLEALVSNKRCLEIHVSDNDGTKDAHRKLGPVVPWLDWFSTLVNDGKVLAPIFTEALQETATSMRKRTAFS